MRGKLNNFLEVEELQMSSLAVVEAPQRGDGAKPTRKIAEVVVSIRHTLGTTVEAGGRINTVGEVVRDVGVVFVKCLRHIAIFLEHLGCKRREGF